VDTGRFRGLLGIDATAVAPAAAAETPRQMLRSDQWTAI